MNNSYFEKLEAEFEPLNQAIEEIELYLKVEVIPVGGLHRKIKKPSETPPKEIVETAYREAAEVFFRLDTTELQKIASSDKDVRDNLIVTVTDMLLVLTDLTDKFKSKVEDADIILETNAAISRFTTAIKEAIEGDGEYRFKKAKDAAERMLECAKKVISQSYLDEVVPAVEAAPLSDSLMRFLSPDESELHCSVPSVSEVSYVKEVEWFKDNKPCNVLFANDEYLYREPFFVNDCLNRLWGKSTRIRNDTQLEISQMAQMPRLVMYPFYAAFFDMASRLYDSVEQYKSGKLKPVRGSFALWNPMDGGQRLLWRMKDVLRYAPREYFEPGRQHEVYTRLIGHVFSDVMDALLKVIPKDARFQCAATIGRAKIAFGNIMRRLKSPAEGSEREYVEESEKMVDGFKDEIIALSGLLKCVEEEIDAADMNSSQDSTVGRDEKIDKMSSQINDIHKILKPRGGRPEKGKALYSQKVMAEMLGVSEDTVYRWERGDGNAPSGYSRELRERGRVDELTAFVKDYKTNRYVKDVMNSKHLVRNMSEEQVHRETLK